MVVTRIAARAISSRERSSVRWSTNDIVASGLVRLRLRRGSSRLNRPPRTENLEPFTTFGQRRPTVLSGPCLGVVLIRGRRGVDPLRLHGRGALNGVRFVLGLHVPHLGLEDAQ